MKNLRTTHKLLIVIDVTLQIGQVDFEIVLYQLGQFFNPSNEIRF
ncbi:hypothetical protein [Vibrio amylolyticus]|nr:hypothetical protein [Vibrio amylolyticus]